MKREIKFRAWHKGYSAKGKFTAIEPRMLYDDKIGDCLGYAAQGQPVELMQFTGLKDKNGVDEWYEDDILLFDYVEDGFHNSTAGEIMKQKGADQLLIHIVPSEYLQTKILIYFLKKGNKITENEWFGYEVENGNKPYFQKEGDAIHFLRYLSNKNLRLIGNIYQHPELL